MCDAGLSRKYYRISMCTAIVNEAYTRKKNLQQFLSQHSLPASFSAIFSKNEEEKGEGEREMVYFTPEQVSLFIANNKVLQ